LEGKKRKVILEKNKQKNEKMGTLEKKWKSTKKNEKKNTL
jgi:hypothetical protein